MNKKMAAGVVGAAVLTGAVYLKVTYQVARVIDGDTFETVERQKIRLSGAAAPELTYCGGPEAKAVLEKMILGKRVFIKVVFNDFYKRLVSNVYAGNVYVNQKMMEQGWTYLSSASGPEAKKLAEATKIAREKKLGIFGTSCTQTVNLKNAKCDIKGNQTSNGLGKFYHYPGCGHYEETDVQLYRGEQWFCTKSEAEKAGFKKADLCP